MVVKAPVAVTPVVPGIDDGALIVNEPSLATAKPLTCVNVASNVALQNPPLITPP